MERLCREDVLELLPERDPFGHKGNFGKLLALCGSVGYTGAAALACRAAVRSGAGLVFLGVPQSIYAIEAIKLDEPIVFPLPEKEGRVCSLALPEILRRLPSCDACLMGPGLGLGEEVTEVVLSVLKNASCPVVLDADGITAASLHKDVLRERTGTTILTPHDGEFRRMGIPLGADRAGAAMALANDLGVIVLLKGHRTLITDGKRVYENTTGNPGMAAGGSGDVLAGLLTSLLGQGLPPLKAAACAAWIHGAAGDLAAQELGQYGMTPSDMVSILPRLLK